MTSIWMPMTPSKFLRQWYSFAVTIHKAQSSQPKPWSWRSSSNPRELSSSLLCSSNCKWFSSWQSIEQSSTWQCFQAPTHYSTDSWSHSNLASSYYPALSMSILLCLWRSWQSLYTSSAFCKSPRCPNPWHSIYLGGFYFLFCTSWSQSACSPQYTHAQTTWTLCSATHFKTSYIFTQRKYPRRCSHPLPNSYSRFIFCSNYWTISWSWELV